MANPKHLRKLSEGVLAWNRWRKVNPGITPDLSGAHLYDKKFDVISFDRVNLNNANLQRAYLRKASFEEADLSEADLRNSDISGANMRRAKLVGADAREADLHGTDLSQANLHDADLRGTKLYGTNLTEANLREAQLSGTDLHEAQLFGASLRQAVLVRTNLERANITECSIYGISAWEVNLTGATQANLRITRPDQATVTVDDLEVAQLIFLLLNHKKLRTVINSITERGVLILGRFGDGGLKILQAIASKLRELGYLPIIFDFDKPESRDFTETVKTLVGLSRFVIADLSGPSVPQELYATVPHYKIPFVPIIEKNRKRYSMFLDLLAYPWVLPPVEYENMDELIKFVPIKIITPAEKKFEERKALLEKIFTDL